MECNPASEAREEERGSLEAIYGEDFEALAEHEWRIRLGEGRLWLCFALPDSYPLSLPPVARIEIASGPPVPGDFAGCAEQAVTEHWSPGESCVYSCCLAVEERLHGLHGHGDVEGTSGQAPVENAACTVPIEAETAKKVGSSLLAAGFQGYPGGLFSHLTKAITVYVTEELTVTVDGIEAEDLTDWLSLQLEDPGSFGASLVEWATAQRSEEPGFAEGPQAAESGIDFLPSPEALNVNRERELTILTWGKAFRKQAPPESQANFNAGILNGRGGGADIRVDNGLTEAVQRNVASCGLFPRWLEMVINKIEAESLQVVSINCTKGRHRSVAAAEILKQQYYPNASTVHTSPAIKR